jgi:hypothetical protein
MSLSLGLEIKFLISIRFSLHLAGCLSCLWIEPFEQRITNYLNQ